jgi:IS66 C-terminal element
VPSPSGAATGLSPAPTKAAGEPPPIYTLIATAKLNEVDPQAWLADVLARLPDYPAKRVHELLPGNWHAEHRAAA